MTISLIACMARNGAIGFDNHLLYSIPEDMHRFKELTTGHTVLMGRKTFTSLPNGALPHRRNIVLSNTLHVLPQCDVCSSIHDALEHCHSTDIFVIGGKEVYAETLPLASRLYLTIIDDIPPYADTFFPVDFDQLMAQGWRITKKEEKQDGTLHYSFIDMEK